LFLIQTAALKIALEEAGFTVVVNAQKPRVGCFVVTRGDDEKVIELLNMPRPFVELRDLDLDEVIQTILEDV
jgi:hypothetical protein